MTREEIEELKGLAASMGLYDDKKPCKRAVILGKAIQELEQEPIDKIRAEIAKYGSIWVTYTIIGRKDSDIEQLIKGVLKQAKEQVLDIIDKYKEET